MFVETDTFLSSVIMLKLFNLCYEILNLLQVTSLFHSYEVSNIETCHKTKGEK